MEIHSSVEECRHIFSITKKGRLWLKREAEKKRLVDREKRLVE